MGITASSLKLRTNVTVGAKAISCQINQIPELHMKLIGRTQKTALL
jgi:hypothetical protein